MDLGAVVLARKVETGWLGVTRKGEFLLRKFVVISLGWCAVPLAIVGGFGGISGMQEIRRAGADTDFCVGQVRAGQVVKARR